MKVSKHYERFITASNEKFIENCEKLLKKTFPVSWEKMQIEPLDNDECFVRYFETDINEQVLESLMKISKTNNGYIELVDCYNGEFVDSMKIE